MGLNLVCNPLSNGLQYWELVIHLFCSPLIGKHNLLDYRGLFAVVFFQTLVIGDLRQLLGIYIIPDAKAPETQEICGFFQK